LRKLAASSREPLARLHGAWLLEALGALEVDVVLQLLHDGHPRVREHAVLLSERWLPKSAAVQERVLALAADPHPRLRWQVALSLGEGDGKRILTALAQIALAGAEDRWTRMAVASSVPHRAGALIVRLCRPDRGLPQQTSPGRLVLLQELAALAGA